MATVQVCDGCGEKEGPMETLGLVIQRDYCGDCVPDVHRAMEKIDELQESLAIQWRDELARIREGWDAKHAGFSLPDR